MGGWGGKGGRLLAVHICLLVVNLHPIWLTFTADPNTGAAIGGGIGGALAAVLIIVVIVVVVVVICKTKGDKGMFLHVYMHATILVETTAIMLR